MNNKYNLTINIPDYKPEFTNSPKIDKKTPKLVFIKSPKIDKKTPKLVFIKSPKIDKISNIKFEIINPKFIKERKELKESFNIWKNNTDFKPKEKVNHQYAYDYGYHDRYDYVERESNNNYYYDEDYGTWDNNEKLYGDHDDWEDYYDSVYN